MLVRTAEFRARRARHVEDLSSAVWTSLARPPPEGDRFGREVLELANAMRDVLARLQPRYPSIALAHVLAHSPLQTLPHTAYTVYFDASGSSGESANVISCPFPGWIDQKSGKVYSDL
ncbi:hypothetical protein H9P43_008513 [Blastocladiella emersonii ATCC 22665]|nr:hypothetical protein H9P43_008513 [Blastocladiella emersonii ATCC 22665]